MIEGYLEGSKNLRHVLQLVDIRHAPTQEDQMMTEYLRHYNLPFTVVATKADKAVQGPARPLHSGDLPRAGRAAMGGSDLFL